MFAVCPCTARSSREDFFIRQVSRRESLGRVRYEYTVLQQRLEEINTQLRSLETLGAGMTTMDYEALYIAHLSCKDKLEEREREVEKLRQRYQSSCAKVSQAPRLRFRLCVSM